MSIPALSVRNLGVAFHQPYGLEPVVEDISFDLHSGEIVGLVGESGCGKSVTARALMGLLPGHVAKTSMTSLQLDGSEISTLNEKGWRKIRGKKIAMVFQEPATALDPVFTIGNQINCVLRRHEQISKKAAMDKSLHALKSGGFNEPQQIYDAYPHQLSGGMRQLAMIALAMSAGPGVLIADEPTTALDVTTQSIVIDRIKQLQEEFGTAVLLVTHDFGLVAQSCSRAMVMYCGRLVEQSDYSKLFTSPLHPYTRGLLSSVPRVTGGEKARAIPGRVPSYSQLPAGCHFAARCDRADEVCRQTFPSPSVIDVTVVACHHPLEPK
jgi:peptide/nickel transport system ATP-binding protein